jgi:hypothetical protein
MDLNRFNRKRTDRIYLYILLILACSFISFLLGIVTLRNGTIRKLYDIYDSISYLGQNDVEVYSNFKPDTLYLDLSKKNYNRIVKLRSDSFLNPKNYLNYSWQWLGERPWYKVAFSNGEDSFKSAKLKLIGMNADHFREGKNWSLRVKLDDDHFYKGYRKFNLLNPYSRGFFIDQFYNTIYKKEGGLYIGQIPVYTKLGENLNPQLLEPFFSKELLESQQRRDYLILTVDSNDKKGKQHLKVVHPKNDIASLTKRQQEVYLFYDSLLTSGSLEKYYNVTNYAFLTAVALITGGTSHHFNGFNLYLFADPISGDLKPFLREISAVETGEVKFNYDILKSQFYSTYKLEKSVQNFREFDYQVNRYVDQLNKINIDEFVRKDAALSDLYLFNSRNYFWSPIYKNRLLVNLDKVHSARKQNNPPKRILNFSGLTVINDTALYLGRNDSLVFNKEARIVLKNASLIFTGIELTYNDNQKKLTFVGDSLSTLIFDNCKIDFEGVNFTGFGNRLHTSVKNRELTGATTFANSSVKLKNVDFSGNYLGDDLVNFYRSKVNILNSNFRNAKADGIDFDFTTGSIVNSKVINCGNDGLDLGGSSLLINSVSISSCGDKGISIGEASRDVNIRSVLLSNNEIGVSLKDESIVSFNDVNFLKNKVDFVAYAKKAQYGHSRLQDSNVNFSNVSYLIEPGVVMPKGVVVARTPNVIDFMYGKKYGRQSVR